ncbi:hypothetical protein F4821DRAFT_278438 [Hypoxylon rubiginosum]|uniref:Uncharacterized protein n=1 Tax=Hypoxylon rubiginosum TaxID=110542 RepID=A0ACC0D238_9PEZI|nr:hypothetical protein F4821DRAFT_278438 [Hypoxylon rubiginosum]
MYYYETPSHNIAAGIILPVVDIIAVGLRFWVRTKQKQALKADDWLLVPATIMIVGIGILMVYGVSQEALAHNVVFPEGYTGSPYLIQTDQLELNGKLEWAFNVMFPLVLGCTKASFLFFYQRIFSVNKNSKTTILLTTMIVLVAAWTAAFFFALFFMCGTDFEAIWGPTVNLYTICTKTLATILSLCFTDFFADIMIITIPIPLIWRLNLSKNRKIGISAIFLLGIVTIAASLTRLIISAQFVIAGFYPTADEILIVTLYIYWAMIEAGIGILVACLPTLAFLFRGFSWGSIVTTTRSLLRSSRWGSRTVHPGESYVTLEHLESGRMKDASVYPGLPRHIHRAVSHDHIAGSDLSITDEIPPVPSLEGSRSHEPILDRPARI